MRVVIDRDMCIGSGNCVRLAGDVFDQDDEAIAVVLDEHPDASRSAAVREAVEMCPAGAISVVDD